MKPVILAVSIAAASLPVGATEYDVREHAINGDRYTLASLQLTEGRNDRVSVSQKMVAAIKKSASQDGKCVAARINPGQSKAAWHQRIRQAFKGVIPRSTVTSVKITARFMHKATLKRICVIADGRGHS